MAIDLHVLLLDHDCHLPNYAVATPGAVWTALLATLVVKFLQLRSCFGWNLLRLVALLQQQLFVCRDF